MAMDKQAFDIIGLGEAMVEFNQRTDGSFGVSCGGDTSNCVIAAARLGATSGYISRLGDDLFAEILHKQWAEDGVDARHVIKDSASPSGIYFVTHGVEGHDFTYRRNGSAASMMRPTELPWSYIQNAKILHVSGISQAISNDAAETVIAAIKCAKDAGVLVSYDTNLRLKLWPLERAREVIHSAIAFADIARPSIEDTQKLTGLTDPNGIADFYLGLGAGMVALTLGAKGAFIATPESREFLPVIVVDSIDATGAGDAFGGAFLARLAAGDMPIEAARYANVAAALSTTKYGAVSSFPTAREVAGWIQANL